jgi:IclR family transcriptional regulator, acetate operon repressor
VDQRLPRWLPAMTERTLTTREELHAVLATTREQGWAMDDQEVADGLRCYAVALPLATPPIDAVSVAVPTFRITPEREQLILRALLEAQRAVAATPTGRVGNG